MLAPPRLPRAVPAHRTLVLLLALGLLAGCSDELTETSKVIPPLRAPEHGPIPTLPLAPEAQIELGRALFYDFRLSNSGQTNCDRCHIAATSFQDNSITSVPDSSYPEAQPHLRRNTTSMLNLVYAPVTRWDGSHSDLVEVSILPLAEPNMNLGLSLADAQATLKTRLTQDIPGYLPRFKQAFDADLEALDASEVWRLAGQALLAFLGLAVSRDSPFDAWNAGNDSAMNDAAVRGLDVFRGKGRCSVCHSGPFFTDFSFHNISTSLPDASGARADEGRFEVTGNDADRGAFLTPTLRSVAASAPYFHDGGAGHLLKAIEHFASDAVLLDPLADPVLNPPPALTDDDIADLAELLRALTGKPLADQVGAPDDLP